MTELTPNETRTEIRRLKRKMRADRVALAKTNRQIAQVRRQRASVMSEMAALCPGRMKQ